MFMFRGNLLVNVFRVGFFCGLGEDRGYRLGLFLFRFVFFRVFIRFEFG